MRKGYSNHFSVFLSRLDLEASALTTAQTATSRQQLKNYTYKKSEILQFRAIFEKNVHSCYSNTIWPTLTTVQTATSTQQLKNYTYKKSEFLQFHAVFEKVSIIVIVYD